MAAIAPRRRRSEFVRVVLVLPTEYAYAREVLRGIIAATRERNMYAGRARAARGGTGGRHRSQRRAGRGPEARPWLFRVYRGIYGHSSKYLKEWFRDWDPDGIICQIYDDRLAKVYRDTGKPVVELFESRAASEFPRILPDDVATGELAGRHFLERGFRHFGFFGDRRMLWSREREVGFRLEIERQFRARADATASGGGSGRGSTSSRGFTFASYGEVDAGVRVPAAFGASARRRAAAMGDWLASLPKPLALFAANDLWGFELVQAARERGLHVPDQVAVLGVDNEELLCEIAHPPLSSIRMGAEQIGRAAVAVLERLLRGGHPPPRDNEAARVPPAEVVTRQSTDVLAVEDPEVAAALRHIRRHAIDGLSVKQLLAETTVNRRTLERRFVHALGHTPLEEIHRVRLERAKALLHTDLPVYEVAARAGYATPEYFATSFLRATRLSPTAYRRQFAPGSKLIASLPPP
jgi:LacI family transcriptional regulator